MTTRTTAASLRALLAGSVDYAGLFPPANLTLEPALQNHAGYARGSQAWMLARCVIPTHRLAAAGALVEGLFEAAHPLAVSALGGKSDSAAEAFEILRAGLAAIAGFRATHGDRVSVEQLEMPLPPNSAPSALRAFLHEAAALIESLGPPKLTAFWEIPAAANWPEVMSAFMEHHAAWQGSRCAPMGAKLRTGGVVATAFPTSAQVAGAMLAARDAGVALKFTAGLHHPLRHFNADLGTRMHGFLNVFAAGVLARQHQLGPAQTAAILAEESTANFSFTDSEMGWKNFSVKTAEIPALRAAVTTFGSCSFDEPVADLRALGLL